MFAARVSRRKQLSSAGIGARSQARAGRRSGPEYWRDGRVQPRQQLEQHAAIAIRDGNYAAAATRSPARANYISRTSLSRLDNYQRWRACAGVQLPLWRPGNTGAFAPDEIRSASAVGSDA